MGNANAFKREQVSLPFPNHVYSFERLIDVVVEHESEHSLVDVISGVLEERFHTCVRNRPEFEV